MTVAHLVLPFPPEAHGVRAALDASGHARIVRGRDKAHGRLLDVYQRAVKIAALDWIEARAGAWPHYNDPVILATLFWLRRPTTYRSTEMWHRTKRGGPRTTPASGRGGDLTSFVRATEDALVGAFYHDDGLVTAHLAGKPLVDRADPERVELWVAGMADAQAVIDAVCAALPLNQQARQACQGGQGTRPSATGYLRGQACDVRSEHTGPVKSTTQNPSSVPPVDPSGGQ